MTEWNSPETPPPTYGTHVTVRMLVDGKEVHHHGHITEGGRFYIPFMTFPLNDPRVTGWKLF